jgi:hypothetical protein
MEQRVEGPGALESGGGHPLTQSVNKQAYQRRQGWRHLPQCAWTGEGIQQQLKCGTLHRRVGRGTSPPNSK